MHTTLQLSPENLTLDVFNYTMLCLPLEAMIQCRQVCHAWESSIKASLKLRLRKNGLSRETIDLLSNKPIFLQYLVIKILEKKRLAIEDFKLIGSRAEATAKEMELKQKIATFSEALPLSKNERLDKYFSDIPDVKRYIARGYAHNWLKSFNDAIANNIGTLLWSFGVVDNKDFLNDTEKNILFTPQGALFLLSGFSAQEIRHTSKEILTCLLSKNGKIALNQYFTLQQAQSFYDYNFPWMGKEQLGYSLFFLDSTLQLFKENAISLKNINVLGSHYIRNLELLLTAKCEGICPKTGNKKQFMNAGGATLLRDKRTGKGKVLKPKELDQTNPKFVETVLSHPYAIVALKYKIISFHQKDIAKFTTVGFSLYNKGAIHRHINDKLAAMVNKFQRRPHFCNAAKKIQTYWRESQDKHQTKLIDELDTLIACDKNTLFAPKLHDIKVLASKRKLFEAEKQLTEFKHIRKGG